MWQLLHAVETSIVNFAYLVAQRRVFLRHIPKKSIAHLEISPILCNIVFMQSYLSNSVVPSVSRNK